MSQGGGGGGSPPDSARYAPFDSITSSFHMKSVTMASSSSQSLATGASESGIGDTVSTDEKRFSQDISRMPDFPARNISHRRAQSEIISLPDDISFDSDLGVVGCMDGPALFDDTEEDLFSMYIDLEKFNTSAGTSEEVLQLGDPSGATAPPAPQQHTGNLASTLTDKPKFRHHHSHSLDGSASVKSELLESGLEHADTKKAMSAAKLADLALVDPKRAKRIWANRQSAARSKERKMRYIAELERKVKTLQTEATTLSAQLNMLQRDTNGLSAENSELKLRLQTIEQQVHLQDAVNDAMREEVQILKLVTGQMTPNASMMNFEPSFGANLQLYNHNQSMQSLIAAHQLQQLQIHSQHQQQFHPRQQQQQQQQPLPAEVRMKGTMVSQTSREGIYEANNTNKE
ncbi:probable transcription factor PosF21 isoform X1 [Dendrobium catenatum]|uniref:Putative transcription factor PosF21 n=1 Tax=Dendrobium catenatum TaxID=906689 RepID=A0A2I0VSU5_9ASPA|nr:probable transcription factor PosF21 isoform X1 [Dendrobium catenatum]PKU66479.1 putative transcription factor PosF21 [Dendrobium catenatum]